MLEATSKVVQFGQENLELFKLLLNSLKVIVYENAEPTAVMVKFLMELLSISGFGDFESNNFMIGGLMGVFGLMLAVPCLVNGFRPEIAKMNAKSIKFIQEE